MGYVFLGVIGLVLVNMYVFVWSRKSLRNVYRAATVEAAVPDRASSSKKKAGARTDRRGGRSLLSLRLPRSITARAMVEQEEEALLEVDAFTTHGVIRRGDNLYAALKRVGVNRLLGDTIVRSLDHLYDFRRARPGQKFSVRLSQDRRRLLGFEFQTGPGEIYRIVRRSRKLVGERVERPLVSRVFELATPVSGSLWETFHRMEEDGRLMAAVVAIFSWDMNFYTDVLKGDTLRLIVEKQYMGDQFVGYGRVLAAEYRGKRKSARAFWYRPPKGNPGYFNAQGRSLHRVLLKAPLKYRRISSKFDRNRMHPILHRVRPHLGVDYAAPTGTPVWAVADGEVIYVGRNRAAGNMIVLDHEQSMRTVYMHLHGFRRGLKKGARVRQREVIGYVGSTGMSTGPHLHFGLKVHGVYLDPEKHSRKRRPPVPRKLQADFKRCIAPLARGLGRLRAADRPYSRLAGKDILKVTEQYRHR